MDTFWYIICRYIYKTKKGNLGIIGHLSFSKFVYTDISVHTEIIKYIELETSFLFYLLFVKYIKSIFYKI